MPFNILKLLSGFRQSFVCPVCGGAMAPLTGAARQCFSCGKTFTVQEVIEANRTKEEKVEGNHPPITPA